MKKFNNIEEFENLVKDQMAKHTVQAPDVWSGVASSTVGAGSVTSQLATYFSSVANIVKVALFAGGITTAGIFLYTENSTNSPAGTGVSSPQPTEEIISLPTEDSDEVVSEELLETDQNNAPTNSNELEDLNESTPNSASNDVVGDHGISTINEGQEQVTEEASKPTDIPTPLNLVVSNTTPCIGESVTIRSCESCMGDWYINGELTQRNTNSVSFTCISMNEYAVQFKMGSEAKTTLLYPAQNNLHILVDNNGTSDTYKLSLDQANTMANWYVNNKLVAKNTSSVLTELPQVGQYAIVAKPLNIRCAGDALHRLTVEPKGQVQFYNIFSPDGDGKNDEYVVDIKNYNQFSIQIFNSRNERVYASTNPASGWNGKEFNTGRECPDGQYVAKINYQLKGEKMKQKHVRLTLVRE